MGVNARIKDRSTYMADLQFGGDLEMGIRYIKGDNGNIPPSFPFSYQSIDQSNKSRPTQIPHSLN